MSDVDDYPMLAIIGTAGRGNDAPRLTLPFWNKVKKTTLQFVEDYGVTHAISGGAAFADHIAVEMFVSDLVHIGKLSLHLPCKFNMDNARFFDNKNIEHKKNPGGILNYYHTRFSSVIKRDSFSWVREAITKGCSLECGGGFVARNFRVAKEANMLLAITFGDGPKLKDGGTSITTKAFIQDKGTNKNAYHLDLNQMRIYKGAIA